MFMWLAMFLASGSMAANAFAAGPFDGAKGPAAGGANTCVVTTATGAKCWGRNQYGQLGDGSTTQRPVPVEVTVFSGGIAAISPGPEHTCVLTSAGGVKCWGNNAQGVLGTTTTGMSLTPVDIPTLGSGVAAVASGATHACALTGSGGVKCWGDNGSGQLGDGTTFRKTTPIDVSGLTGGMTAIATNDGRSCALTGAGGVKCWGDNSGGQLGDGTTTQRLAPIDVSGFLGGAAAISVGRTHTCALTTSGGVKCWGENTNGQLGDGTTSQRLTPVDVAGLTSGVSAVAAGDGFTCALTGSGGVKCWGRNSGGQLGDGTATRSLAPVSVSGLSSGTKSLSAGDGHACALTTDGHVKCWGSGEALGVSTLSSNVPVQAVAAGSGATAVDGGDSTSTAVVDGGAISWWPQRTQIFAAGSGVTAVASGGGHACIVASGGVKCWGSNGQGQLGNGTTTDANPLLPVVAIPGGSGVSSVAAGSAHSCVIANGGVSCWGSNVSGQLGNGSYTQSSVRVEAIAAGSLASAVTAGGNHTCAVVNGGVKCWGSNVSGQLGSGTLPLGATSTNLPVQAIASGSGATAVAAGASHTCAVVNGGVQCWGLNVSGQLGVGSVANSNTPIQVIATGSGASAVTAGDSHSCALVGDGVRCWGLNESGQLGNGNWKTSTVPVQALPAGSSATAVGAGRAHTCAIASGGMKCWGLNWDGQLGNGSSKDRSLEPVEVLIPQVPTSIAFSVAPNPGVAMQPTTLTAVVTDQQGSPTGTVTFKESGSIVIGEANVDAMGTAVISHAFSAASHALTAVYSGDGRYLQASSAEILLVINKAAQTISFGAAPTLVVGGTGTVVATATSGLAVTFTSLTASICTVSGATVTGVAAGTCTIAADQAGNTSFDPASRVTQSFEVTAGAGFALTVTRSGTGAGTVTSSPAGINCGSTCTATFASGTAVTLTATAATGSTFAGWSGGGCSGTGACAVTLSAATTITAAFSTGAATRLSNIATRAPVLTGDHVMIGGFIIQGSTPKKVLVTARGPSMAAQGVTGTLADPFLTLYSGATPIATNDDFGSAGNAAEIPASMRPSNAKESAILMTLSPGAYTAIVTGVGGATGIGIVEAFEVDAPDVPFINIATRAPVLTGDNVMIGGFIISGDTPKTVVVRARGPSLAAAGVPGVLADPAMTVYAGATVIATNDNWGEDANAAAVLSSGLAPSDAKESALHMTLNPGAYTVIVTGAIGATGIGMVEVFAQ